MGEAGGPHPRFRTAVQAACRKPAGGASGGVNTGRMRKWLSAAVGVNVLLGVPGVVPACLLRYYVSNGPLADLGRTRREPTENDGMLLWLLIVVPVNVVLLLVRWPTARCGAGRGWIRGCTGRRVP